MYYPYLRGRQNELLTLTTLRTEIAANRVIPIVEPCTKSYKQFEHYANAEMEHILVVNPRRSKVGVTTRDIHNGIIEKYYSDFDQLNIGILITGSTRINEVKTLLDKYAEDYDVTIIHMEEFHDKSSLVLLLKAYPRVTRHVFDDDGTKVSYQSTFKKGKTSVLLKDSFDKKARNVDYPTTPYLFSDLHTTYAADGFDGFGDYTITGNTIGEGGGPANAVAIHLTHLKRGNVNMVHFISDRTTGTTDVAGKFREANTKLNAFVTGTTHVFGQAVPEFQELHDRRHYPGLGISKRLSLIRHIEVYLKVV